MRKLEIEIPNDKEIDWEASAKQKQIVLKNQPRTYEDICTQIFESGCWYLDSISNILYTEHPADVKNNSNNATTRHQLECILAKNKLANVARYLNGNWIPDTSYDGNFDAYVLYVTSNKNYIGYIKINSCSQNSNVLFKSKELALQAVKILGEDVITLALEPLF